MNRGKSTVKQAGAEVVAIGVAGAMFAVFPYFQGYDANRSTLLHYFLKSWTDYQGEWTHCLFVPFLVAGLVYLQWPELRRFSIEGNARLGGGVLLVAFLLYWLGYAMGENYLGYLSMHVIYAGLILWFLGLVWFENLLFPLIFLIFMWPMGFLDDLLAFPLRKSMTTAAHYVLQVLGVGNLQSGTAILSAPDFAHGLAPGAKFAIDVAEPCSGLHSLFALIMVSFLYGYVTFALPVVAERFRWGTVIKVISMLLAAIPLAVLGNIVRIVLLVLADLQWGTAFALGTATQPSWFHEFAGYVVFIVALGGLVVIGEVIRRTRLLDFPEATSPPAVPPQNRQPPLPRRFSTTVPAILAALTLLACSLTPDPSGQSAAGVRMILPSHQGVWWGTEGHITPIESQTLPADTQLIRKEYESGEGDQVSCTIVLAGAEKRSIHRPEICLPGQGWTIKSGEVIPITLPSGRILQVMKLTLSRPWETPTGRREVNAYFLYWFVGNGVTTPYHWERIWLTSWDRLVHHRNHRWAYVSVFSVITEGLNASNKNPEETIGMLKNFIAEVAPSFQLDLH